MAEVVCYKHGCKDKVVGVCLVLAANGRVTETPFCQRHIGDLGLDYLLPKLEEVHIQPSDTSYESCEIHKIIFFYESNEYFIILKNRNANSVFVMQTGYVQACSVYGAIKTNFNSAPLTYELIATIVHALDGSIVEAVFDGYNQDLHSYESHLVIGKGNATVKIKCRGSDAIGISFLAKSPIRVNTAFLARENR